ncbi:kelch repeat-containing protein [uncultured Polaribacter sp.]|uniref:Kelch repeat-containing protein n=1 Tax=uncultured Polaribacter sp. TaxID=174711 RepID=UPI00259BC5F8|nr:kelch repeat-containing protein [uncultured Polaribacter sp.]
MKYIFSTFFFFLFLKGFSQKVTGVVLDFKTKQPIEKAHIFLPNKIIYSNEKGNFLINLKTLENVNFTISHINYQTTKFTFKKTDSVAVFYLMEKQEFLDGVEITSNNTLQKNLKYKVLRNLPVATYSFASIIKNGNIYVFGGDASSKVEKNKQGLAAIQFSNQQEIMRFLRQPKPISFNAFKSDIQIYNIDNKNWSLVKEKMTKRAYHKAIYYKNEVYILGGKKLSKKKTLELLVNEIEIVSLNDFTLKKDKTNPYPSVDFDAVLYDDKIIVFGGSTKKRKNGNKVYSDEVHMYDLKTGYWYLLTRMSKGKEVSGIVFNDKLYFFGGFYKKALTEIESFNLKTGKWKIEGNLFAPLRKPTLTKDNEFIYLQESDKILRFNPKTKILQEYSIDLNLEGAKLHFYNEILYIVGGYQVEDYRKFPSNKLYSLNISEFLKTQPTNSKNSK